MIFQHTWQWILEPSPHTGELKTLTSRLRQPGDEANLWRMGGEDDMTINEVLRKRKSPTKYGDVWRQVYGVDKTYAIQPQRTGKAIGRFTLLEICQYDVRNISEQEARDEGFESPFEYLRTWVRMHDPGREWAYEDGAYHYWAGRACGWQAVTETNIWDMVRARPAARYQAWQLRLAVNG